MFFTELIDPFVKVTNFEWLQGLNIWSIIIRLIISVLIGGIIGLERAFKHRAAGFRTYASVCIKNHIVSLLRNGQRAKHSALLDYVSIDEIDIESKNQPETDWIEKEAFFDIKKQIIKVLSGFELEALRLYLYGFSYKDIAEKLEKSEKSVSNALSRVRKKLRAAIGPEQ